jgi:hypothetical protein
MCCIFLVLPKEMESLCCTMTLPMVPDSFMPAPHPCLLRNARYDVRLTDLLLLQYLLFLFPTELCESCVLPAEFSSYSHPHLSACSALFCVISFFSVQFKKPFLVVIYALLFHSYNMGSLPLTSLPLSSYPPCN